MELKRVECLVKLRSLRWVCEHVTPAGSSAGHCYWTSFTQYLVN